MTFMVFNFPSGLLHLQGRTQENFDGVQHGLAGHARVLNSINSSFQSSPQGRTPENFDHVQHGLALDMQEEAEASKSSGLRNMSEDMKRTLGALHVSIDA